MTTGDRVLTPGLASFSSDLAMRPAFLCATAAGFALAGAYACSPMTVFYLVAVALMMRWAIAGLEGTERRWIAGLLSVAIAVRLLLVIGLFLYAWRHDFDVMSFFYDERYSKQRSLWMRDTWLGIPLAPVNFGYTWEVYGWSGYYYILAYFQVLLGPMPYGTHLLNGIISLFTSIAMFRLARRAYGPLPASLGLVLLLFTPSLLMWSISALKEPLSLFLSSMAVIGAAAVLKGRTWWRRGLGAAMIVLACEAIGMVRIGAFGATASGVGLGIALAFVVRRFWRVAVAVLLVAGALVAVSQRPSLHAMYEEQIRVAAGRHRSNVLTPGYSYKLLDDRFYEPDDKVVDTMTPPERQRYIMRAIWSFFTVPLPWNVMSKPALALMPQQMLWFVLVLLVPLGVIEGLKRDPLVTSLLVGFSLVNVIAIALVSGNVGTLVRHRDLAVPFILWLSALGAVSAVARLAGRIAAARETHSTPIHS